MRLAERDNKKKYLKLIPYAWELINHRIKEQNQFNNLMLGNEKPKIYFALKQKLEEWSIATGDNLPENLTRDWYLREPVNNTNGMKTKTSNKAKNYSKRGEMPGFAKNATRIDEKGPF